ncbi:MAG TPA: PaaI family thioesterase [Gaiellaceae bacterium]|nr:PaaI family thioesterase [Gaiellaceae bacterium]
MCQQNELLGASPFDRHYGLEILEAGDELVRGRVPVREHVTQPMGIVHGGVYASIAEGLASVGTNHGVGADGMVALGMSNHSTFLRPVARGGVIEAVARRRHRGRTTWVWDVDITDSEGRLCCASRVTIAVRPMPEELKARFGLV